MWKTSILTYGWGESTHLSRIKMKIRLHGFYYLNTFFFPHPPPTLGTFFAANYLLYKRKFDRFLGRWFFVCVSRNNPTWSLLFSINFFCLNTHRRYFLNTSLKSATEFKMKTLLKWYCFSMHIIKINLIKCRKKTEFEVYNISARVSAFGGHHLKKNKA